MISTAIRQIIIRLMVILIAALAFLAELSVHVSGSGPHLGFSWLFMGDSSWFFPKIATIRSDFSPS
jgi:hypothetical protein